MDKASMVTLWIDPAAHQILKYEFRNIDMDFLPGRAVVRIDGFTATMEMGQPFPEVWLPGEIRVGIGATMATGEITARYAAEFHDYRLAAVSARVR
jgi:hypothetical protein